MFTFECCLRCVKGFKFFDFSHPFFDIYFWTIFKVILLEQYLIDFEHFLHTCSLINWLLNYAFAFLSS